jgi:FdhD protein
MRAFAHEGIPLSAFAGSARACDAAVATVAVCRVPTSGRPADGPDLLAVESPLEIRVGQLTTVTMRTPGHDKELALGYLLTEGIITESRQVTGVRRCRAGRVACVDLAPDCRIDDDRLRRRTYVASSCGACGKASLAALEVPFEPRRAADTPIVAADIFRALPARLREAQSIFDRTGGLHAAALFDPAGHLLCVREDVGRHNALDKLIGHEFLAGRVPMIGAVVLVSGRASFELVQKAAVAGIPVLAAVGAPSTLAVQTARRAGITLVGFLRDDRFNVYTGGERIRV